MSAASSPAGLATDHEGPGAHSSEEPSCEMGRVEGSEGEFAKRGQRGKTEEVNTPYRPDLEVEEIAFSARLKPSADPAEIDYTEGHSSSLIHYTILAAAVVASTHQWQWRCTASLAEQPGHPHDCWHRSRSPSTAEQECWT